MSALKYTTVDKTAWGEGEWLDEPDTVQWVDDATGLDCLAVRHPRLGHWCGYVGVPPEHALHGVEYSDHDDDWNFRVDVYVHGGLTYSDACQEGEDPSQGICHVPESGRPDNVWWFGFDCAHSGDMSPAMEHIVNGPRWDWEQYRTLSYVRGECASLAVQLVQVQS